MKYSPDKGIIMGRIISLLTAGLFILCIMGCGQKSCEVQVRTEYVEVPTACKVVMPKQPVFKVRTDGSYSMPDVTSNVLALIQYADNLEMALYCCTEDPRCVTKKFNGKVNE